MVMALVMMMILSTSVVAEQKSTAVDVYYVPMNFKFNSKQFAPPEAQRGFIYEGSAYVPIRFVSYSLGKAVKWDGNSYTVTVEEPSKTDLISIQEYNLNTEIHNQELAKVDTSKLAASNIQVYKEKVTYVFNGQAKTPAADLPGLIIDGSLYVPMRFFSESIGQKIDWDPVTYTVSASVPAPIKEEPKAVVTPAPTATPKPSTAPNVSGGGGGGGTVAKPTYDSLKADADNKISALQNNCMNKLTTLLDEYKQLTSASEKAAKKNQGLSALAECDASFEQIITSFESKLSANNYDLSIITQYRSDYELAKSVAKAMIGI
jgi:hypothetical protein